MQNQQQSEPTKKTYKTPQVIDYGTLNEQTAGSGAFNPTADGTGQFSS